VLAFQIVPKKNLGIFNGLAGVSLSWMIRDSISRRYPKKSKLLKESRNFEDSVAPSSAAETSVAHSLRVVEGQPIPMPPGMYLSMPPKRVGLGPAHAATLCIRSDILPEGMTPETFAKNLEEDLSLAAMSDNAIDVEYRQQSVLLTNAPVTYIAPAVPVDDETVLHQDPMVFFDRRVREALYLSLVADPRVMQEIGELPDIKSMGFEIVSCKPSKWRCDGHYNVEFVICAEIGAPVPLGLECVGYDLTLGMARPKRFASDSQ